MAEEIKEEAKAEEKPAEETEEKEVQNPKAAEEMKPAEKKIVEDPKPTEPTKIKNSEASGSQTSTTPAKSGGSSAALIIIIIVILLVVLGVGGYFVWKMISNKTISALTNASVTPIALLTQTPLSVTATATASATATKTVRPSTSGGDYIISDSDTRIISETELANLSNWQLKVARNEIYARYGRPFVHKDLQCYFAKKSWYSKDSSAANPTLSSIENANVATIQTYEKKIGSSLADSDSGCDTNS